MRKIKKSRHFQQGYRDQLHGTVNPDDINDEGVLQRGRSGGIYGGYNGSLSEYGWGRFQALIRGKGIFYGPTEA